MVSKDQDARVRAVAELAQAGTRHARTRHDGGAESVASRERLTAGYRRAMHHGMSFDEAVSVHAYVAERVAREPRRR